MEEMGRTIVFFLLIVFWMLRMASRGAKKDAKSASKKSADNGVSARKPDAAPGTPLGPAMEARMKKEFPHLYQQAEQLSMLSPEAASGSLPSTAPEGSDPCHDDMHAMPSGSLGDVGMEGTDPCHDDWKPVSAPELSSGKTAAQPGGLNLHWTGDEIVKGFVYGEILKRKIS